MNVFGRYIWEARGRKGWSRLELAVALVKSLGPGVSLGVDQARRFLIGLEQDDRTDVDLFRAAAIALGERERDVDAFIARIDEKEARELEAWLDVPVPMRMVFPAIPGIWCSKELRDMTEEEAKAFVSKWAERWFAACALEVNRRLRIWYRAKTGLEWRREVREKAEESDAPYTLIDGVRDGVRFECGEVGAA
jgi:transcriptional regulator with XRE-family HTH domain